MTIQTTRWSPDTCECVLEYTWDDLVPADQRTHTFARHLNTCSKHAGLSGQARYNAALQHNQRKNFTASEILERFTALVADTGADGSKRFKNGVTFNWSYSGVDDARVLTVSLSGVNLTNQQKNALQTALDTRFGAGRVVVG